MSLDPSPWLIAAAVLDVLASIAHLACIALGAPAYRVMGAGERMARLAEAGAREPTVVTLAIAAVLDGWALYALSGAGIVPRLPFTGPVLAVISAVLLLRAIAFPLLKRVFPDNSATFWWVSSAVCAVLGGVHAVGAGLAWERL